ncbi:MAG: universal stress protein [Planctomycetes bacterium]|nr:universal stress protein [Planctomycetota bacterium]
MTILCGTDFSPSAKQAANVAAAIAAKSGEPLHLVHSINELAAEKVLATGQSTVYEGLKRWLEEEAQRLRGLGADVKTQLLAGIPDAQMAQAATSAGARMMVVGHVGQRRAAEILLGSVAERLCQIASRPVLVVRANPAIEAWLKGERHLRVLVAADFTTTARAALAWLGELRKLGPCDVVLGHVAWPPSEHHRYGLRGQMPLDRLRPELEEMLRRDLVNLVGEVVGKTDTRIVVEPGLGRVDQHVVDLAVRENIDLVVVGSHQRQGLARLWHTSVSKGVLQLAPMSVVLVPAAAAASPQGSGKMPQLQRLLVPTDFSPLANRAIPFAYAMLHDGGFVHLVHVAEDGGPDPKAIESQLRGLVPAEATGRGIHTKVEVLPKGKPAEVLCQAAERLGVDAVVLGSHGRTGLASVLLGSVATGVLAGARRPVFIVPRPTQ